MLASARKANGESFSRNQQIHHGPSWLRWRFRSWGVVTHFIREVHLTREEKSWFLWLRFCIVVLWKWCFFPIYYQTKTIKISFIVSPYILYIVPEFTKLNLQSIHTVLAKLTDEWSSECTPLCMRFGRKKEAAQMSATNYHTYIHKQWRKTKRSKN